MANRKQIGTDYLLFINVGTDMAPNWKIPLCQSTVTVNSPLETIDASSKCGPDTAVTEGIATIEMEGQILQKDVANTAHMSLFDLYGLRDAKQLISFKVAPKGEAQADDGKIIYSGKAYITNVSDTYGNNEMGTTSISLSVSGTLNKEEFVYTT